MDDLSFNNLLTGFNPYGGDSVVQTGTLSPEFQLALGGATQVSGPDLENFKELAYGQRAFVAFGQMLATGSTSMMDQLKDDNGKPINVGFNFDNIPAGTSSDELVQLIRDDPKVRAELLGGPGQKSTMDEINKAMRDYTYFAETGSARGENQSVNMPAEQTDLGKAAKAIFGVANDRTMTATFLALSEVDPASAQSSSRGGSGPGTTHREVANLDPTKFSIMPDQIARGLETLTENPTSPEGMQLRAFAQEINSALQ